MSTPAAQQKSSVEVPRARTESESSNNAQTSRPKRKGRAKKRKSSEVDSSEISECERKGAKRSSTRTSRRTAKLKFDENEDPSMHIIREEDMIDLDETTSRRAVPSRILNNSTNTGNVHRLSFVFNFHYI